MRPVETVSTGRMASSPLEPGGSVLFEGNSRPNMPIIRESNTPADAAVAEIQPLIEAGINWLLDSFWTEPNDTETIRRRIAAGPTACP